MSDEYLTIFAIMPKEIYKTKELSPEDKLIAERLVYLCKKEGFSWVTNKTLADMYGIKEDSVSQHITNLKIVKSNNPEELKQYQELEEIFKEFRGDSNE